MIVYSPTSAYCHYCVMVKQFLEKHGVAYREVKTDQFPGESRSQASYPRLQIGDRWIRGYNPDELARQFRVTTRADPVALKGRVVYGQAVACRSCR